MGTRTGPGWSVTVDADRLLDAVALAAMAGAEAATDVLADQMRRGMGSEGGGVVGAELSPLMGGPATGRRRRRRGVLRYHPAPPGAYPGVRLGNLRRSIGRTPGVRVTRTQVRARAGVRRSGFYVHGTAMERAAPPWLIERYALWLEFGTSRMAARPWALRSLRDAWPRMQRACLAAMRKHLAGDKRRTRPSGANP